MAIMSDKVSKTPEEVIDHIEQHDGIRKGDDPEADKAAAMLQVKGHSVTLSHENNKRVLRKIDTKILPVILAIYFLQALDKVRSSSLSHLSS